MHIPCLHSILTEHPTSFFCKGAGQHGEPEVSPQPVIGSQAPRSAQFPGVRLPRTTTNPPPPPCTEGSPRSGRTLAAANESSRRLREPGRLCPPGIGHAMGSGGRGLGAPRAWLGQACCWVTGRRVSPGNGGGYRSLAGRDGGRAQAGRPRRPQQQRGPRPARSCNLHRRSPDPADAGTPCRPMNPPLGDPGCRSPPGPGPCGGKLSPSQLLSCSFLLLQNVFHLYFLAKLSLCSPGWLPTHNNPPAAVSQVLG